jgi:hypothetical protein
MTPGILFRSALISTGAWLLAILGNLAGTWAQQTFPGCPRAIHADEVLIGLLAGVFHYLLKARQWHTAVTDRFVTRSVHYNIAAIWQMTDGVCEKHGIAVD